MRRIAVERSRPQPVAEHQKQHDRYTLSASTGTFLRWMGNRHVLPILWKREQRRRKFLHELRQTRIRRRRGARSQVQVLSSLSSIPETSCPELSRCFRGGGSAVHRVFVYLRRDTDVCGTVLALGIRAASVDMGVAGRALSCSGHSETPRFTRSEFSPPKPLP